MLKKWLKKRRKRSSKAEAVPKTDEDHDAGTRAKSATRFGKQSPGREKKKKPKSPSRKAPYTSIEKEKRPHSLSTLQSSLRSSLRSGLESAKSVPSLRTYRDMPAAPPQFSVPRLERKAPQDMKKEVPLVRIRPIERPKQPPATGDSAQIERATVVPPIAELPNPPSASTSTPVTPLPPVLPAQRPSSPTSQLSEQTQAPVPPPPTEYLARELSYLGVASPPSIDTALFAYDESEKEEGKGKALPEEPSLIAGEISPPALIETILPVKQPAVPPQQPTESESESDASVRSRSEILQDMASVRPFQDGEFFTATSSQSGSGSKKLHIWIDEVLRSIEAHKTQTVVDFDRYHIKKKGAEEKSEKEKSVVTIGIHRETLMKSKTVIDKALKETIEKSKANMTAAPKGILKSKVVESGTIKYDDVEVDRWDGSDDEEDEEDDDEEETLEEGVESDESSEEPVPIKVFSKSRRQILAAADETEDETTSVDSQSSSSAEVVYETLHQLNPTVSRDDTLGSNNSMNFFYSKMCNMGEVMGYEDGLCQMDDGISVSEDTIASQSTVDGSVNRSGGWMCFDAF